MLEDCCDCDEWPSKAAVKTIVVSPGPDMEWPNHLPDRLLQSGRDRAGTAILVDSLDLKGCEIPLLHLCHVAWCQAEYFSHVVELDMYFQSGKIVCSDPKAVCY